MLIYHITTAAAWEQAQAAGQYRAASLETEGFIHASTAEQVAATGNRFYHGLAGLVLLEIDTALVQPEVRFEPATVNGVVQQFPHIYGPLNASAVTRALAFAPDAQGNFHF